MPRVYTFQRPRPTPQARATGRRECVILCAIRAQTTNGSPAIPSVVAASSEGDMTMGEPINLFEPSVRSNPFPAYERLRNEPLQQIQPGGYWAISRHED